MRLPSNGFQDRLVMTTSIPLQNSLVYYTTKARICQGVICTFSERKRQKRRACREQDRREHIRDADFLSPHEVYPDAEDKYRAYERNIVLCGFGDYGRDELREQGYQTLEQEHGERRENTALAH